MLIRMHIHDMYVQRSVTFCESHICIYIYIYVYTHVYIVAVRSSELLSPMLAEMRGVPEKKKTYIYIYIPIYDSRH